MYHFKDHTERTQPPLCTQSKSLDTIRHTAEQGSGGGYRGYREKLYGQHYNPAFDRSLGEGLAIDMANQQHRKAAETSSQRGQGDQRIHPSAERLLKGAETALDYTSERMGTQYRLYLDYMKGDRNSQEASNANTRRARLYSRFRFINNNKYNPYFDSLWRVFKIKSLTTRQTKDKDAEISDMDE